ncbi:hypothetical protein BST61_g5168 [Cercospora zeina]
MFQNAARKIPRAHRVERQAAFLDQSGRPPYHEDIYGSRDPGEDDGGPAEQCESESDQKHEDRIAPHINSKHSLPRAEVRRLQARKCGLFSGAFGQRNGVRTDGEKREMPVEEDASIKRAKGKAVTRRRATRMSIKPQLAERVAAKRQAEKAEKQALRHNGHASRSKPTASIGSKSSKRAARVVLVEHRDINFAEYKRYCD